MTLTSGATAMGSSGGKITAGSGATSSDSVGKLTLAGTTNAFGAGTDATQRVTYDWKIANFGATTSGTVGTAGTDFDLLAVTGLSVGAGGVSVVTVAPTILPQSGFDPSQTYTWDIVSGTAFGGGAVGTLFSSFHLDATGLASALSVPSTNFSVVDDMSTDDIAIYYSGAPEPTSMMLLGIGVGGMALRRRRRAVCASSQNEGYLCN